MNIELAFDILKEYVDKDKTGCVAEALRAVHKGYKESLDKNNQHTNFREKLATNLLKLWMANKPDDWKPGAWDYNEQGAELVKDTAEFLGISDPWEIQ